MLRNVVEIRPFASALPLLAANVSPLPVLLSRTFCPETGFVYWSSTSTITLPVVLLSATNAFGLTVRLDLVTFGDPAVKVTVAVSVTVPAVRVRVFVSALVAVIVVV